MSAKRNLTTLSVDDPDAAAAYYHRVFGAEIGADGAMALGGRRYRLTAPAAPADPENLSVPDPDVVIARAAAMGGRIVERCADGPDGRSGMVEDPFGHRWRIRRR